MDDKKIRELAGDILESINHFFHTGIDSRIGTKGHDDVIKYQDLIGKNRLADIQTVYRDEMDQGDRKLFHWVNFKTLSMESALHILNITTVQIKLEEAQEEMETAFRSQERVICDLKKQLEDIRQASGSQVESNHRIIVRQQDRILELEDQNRVMTSQLERINQVLKGNL